MSLNEHVSDTLKQRIARVVDRAQLYGWIENAWPRLVAAGCCVGLFLILSWLNVWPHLHDALRFIVLGVLALAFLAALAWLARTKNPSRTQAYERVEKTSNLSGKPLSTLSDAPFDATNPHALALWQAHQRRLAERIGPLAAGNPAPRTERFDPWALRAPVVLLLVVAFFVAGPERQERISAAFAPIASTPDIPIRVDIWSTPPAYTGLPPRTLLADEAFQAAALEPATSQDFDWPSADAVPVGSRITLLASDGAALQARLEPINGGPAIDLQSQEPTVAGSAASLEATLLADSILTVQTGTDDVALPLLIVPDEAPSIRFAEEPGSTSSGALRLSYHASDDYAVQAIHAEIANADEAFSGARPLVEPPRIDLLLPSGTSGEPTETTRDLSAHPWAGLLVDMTLVARDGADQEATSQTRTFTLPARPFREPLALALVEQRRLLAVDVGMRGQALTALEGLAIAPHTFMDDDFATFLALTVTTQRLRLARSDEALLAVLDLLWQLALQVEDGDLSLAAERLRAAEEALSNALENGASPEEISALMDELRQAFEEYMQALAQRMQQSDLAQAPQDMQLQNLNPQSLQEMMDQIENLSELGAADAARQMLEQLREQLDALRGAQPMESREPSPQEQALREAMQELQAIARDQQSLLDQTFPFSSEAQIPRIRPDQPYGQPQNPNRQPNQDGNTNPSDDSSNVQDPLEGLAEEQQALSDRLQQLMDQLRDLGLNPDQLGQAEQAMDGAGEQLEQGNPSSAVPEQGRALDALRQGAQDLAQQLQGDGEGGQGDGEALGQGQQPGQGPPRLFFGPGQTQRGVDPLGRPQRASEADSGERVRIPQESDIQRARDILNEIQRRLGERARPQQELDYLDRLIDRF